MPAVTALNRQCVFAWHDIPFEFARGEVPAAPLVDEAVAVGAGGAEFGADEQQGDAGLSGIDAVDRDVVVNGDKPLSVAAVEGIAQVRERLPTADVRGA